MRRGTTPTFTVKMPSSSSYYTDITVTFVQNREVILTLPFSRLTLRNNTVSFQLTGEETMLFEPECNAEIQLRAEERFGNVLVSDISRLAVRKKYPEDI